MKKENALLLIGYAFVLLFVYAALSKWFAYSSFLLDLKKSPLLSEFAGPLSILLPLIELLTAVLILSSRLQKMGLWFATSLMTLFTLYIVYILTLSEEIPCSCGGIIRNLSWPQHLIFNIIFTALGVFSLWLLYKLKPTSGQDSRTKTNLAIRTLH